MPNRTSESLLIRGLIEKLPPAGAPFPQSARDRWFGAARTIFDLEYGDPLAPVMVLSPPLKGDLGGCLPAPSIPEGKGDLGGCGDPVPQLDVVQGAFKKRRGRPKKAAAAKKKTDRLEKPAVTRTKRCAKCGQDKGYRAYAKGADMCNDCASSPKQKPDRTAQLREAWHRTRVANATPKPSAAGVAHYRKCTVCNERKGLASFSGNSTMCTACSMGQGEEE